MNNMALSNALNSTATDLFVEAGLLRNAGKSVVVYVEGDSDRRLYKTMFDKNVAILPANTFSNVEAVVEKYDNSVDKSNLPFILGIVDRDYRVAANQIKQTANLICTELRDIECEMIDSPAFENLILEFASEKLTKTWPNINDFRAMLIASLMELGRMRAYNHIKSLGIDFKMIRFDKIHDIKTHSMLEEKLIPHLRGAQKAGIVLPEKFSDVKKLTLDKKYLPHLGVGLRLCRGHDAFELIAYYFRKGFARQGIDVSADTLESAIRIGFVPILKSSPTVMKILQWFASNNLQKSII